MPEQGVYVCLAGGLGNQLFMYAAGKALACRTNTDLFLDIKSGFRDDSRYCRKYSLDIFNVDFKNFTTGDFETSRLQRLINKLGPLQYRNVLLEEKIRSLQGIQINKAIQLKGYWQSEDYFKDQWPHLERDFEYTQPLSSYSKKILDKIQSSNSSIAVHFRRLDYRHVLPSIYYSRAIKHLKPILDEAHYLIFADSFEGIKPGLFANINHTIVSTRNDHEDFFLMSSCHHQILANSTYSWWSAYLNKNPNKIVINPRKWGFNIKKLPSWVSI